MKEYKGLRVGDPGWMEKWVRDANTRWVPREDFVRQNTDVAIFKEAIIEHDPPSVLRDFILRWL
jgi:hypothetical protein